MNRIAANVSSAFLPTAPQRRSLPFVVVGIGITAIAAAFTITACTPAGANGGACYGNGSCDDGLTCNASLVCEYIDDGAAGGRCYGNGTCDTGLECENEFCVDPNAPNPEPGPGPEPSPGSPGVNPEPSPGNPGVPEPVEPDVNVGPPITIPGAEDAVVADDTPSAPPGAGGETLGWTEAPLLEGVQVAQNLSSVRVLLPAVASTQDYRVFRLEDGLTLDVTGTREKVVGGTMYCAGYRQRNDFWVGTRELLRVVEVDNITAPGRYVVEAIDRGCPFPGIIGSAHVDVRPINDEIPEVERHDFPIVTKEEVAATYGSVVINGHRPNTPQGFSPTGSNGGIGYPADADPPVVLARTTIEIGPGTDLPPPASTFFDDFENSQPIQFLGDIPRELVDARSYQGRLFENDRWTFYAFGHEVTDMFIDRGQLHTVAADWAQDIFSTNIAYPKRLAQLDDTTYLHITYEAPSSSTNRRYWWLSVCGDDVAGNTYDENGHLQELVLQTSFFYQGDGLNPSVAKWNCFQLFPRDGSPFEIGPNSTRSETDVRVMLNLAGAPTRESVVNLSPDQYGHSGIPPGWFRQIDANGNPTNEGVLDDQMLISPRTRYDVYLRRNRVVMYVNGEQRLCNDFGTQSLTMAEAAVGFGQVLYHSAAERLEFGQSFNDRMGQRYYVENAPFIDHRNWDNLGYDEGIPAPANFDPSLCYTHQ